MSYLGSREKHHGAFLKNSTSSCHFSLFLFILQILSKQKRNVLSERQSSCLAWELICRKAIMNSQETVLPKVLPLNDWGVCD